jgi:hypothetical protein
MHACNALYSACAILFFLQGFGLDGVIASFGLVLDLIAFVLFLIFVLVYAGGAHSFVAAPGVTAVVAGHRMAGVHPGLTAFL